MTKSEFENLVGPVADELFKKINFVYAYHPAISDTDGKKQIANLYETFGMRVILDMYTTACKAEALETDIRKKQLELDALREHLTDLRNAN